MKNNPNRLISGGGTGGHIFPALAIAGEIKKRRPEANILFVGAENRMEMEKVPAAGYKIIGLPVSGFDRKNLFKNIKVLFRRLKVAKQQRPLLVQKTDEELMAFITENLQKRLPFYTKAKHVFNGEKLEDRHQIKESVERLKELLEL